MKGRIAIGLLSIVLLMACERFSAPEKHYRKIMQMQNQIVDNLFELNRYAEYLDAKGLDKFYVKTLEHARESAQEVLEMEALAEDSVLRNAAVELFKVYVDVLETDLLEIKKMVDKPGELSQADDKKLLKLRKQLFATLSEAEKKFAAAQYLFLRTYMPGKELTEPDTTLFEEPSDTLVVE